MDGKERAPVIDVDYVESRNNAKFFRETVIDRADGKCEVCGLFCVYIGEIHHVVSVKGGGSGYPENLIYLCPNCHAIVEKLKALRSTDWFLDNPRVRSWVIKNYGEESADKLYGLAYSQMPENIKCQYEEG
jgi:5-methylcytosine-specific restriction endonuclease McrA